MSIRESKHQYPSVVHQIPRMLNPPPLINDQEKLYCSCPPFECVCNLQQQTNHLSQHQYNNNSQSPTTSYQQTPILDAYWPHEQTDAQPYHQIDNSSQQQYDFANISTDLFQPEEIFQLDQPIKTDFIQHSQNEVSRSPSTLLDLGSGTIHREYKTEDYWGGAHGIQGITNDDSNNSSSTASRLYFNSSPDNSQVSVNNHSPQHSNTNFINSAKIEEVFGVHKFEKNSIVGSDFFTDHLEHEYKNFPDIGDAKMFFGDEAATLDFQSGKSTYKNCNLESRFQDKYDLPQYVDYNTLLNAYDAKTIPNDMAMFNELDFRIGTNLVTSNLHYSPEHFDGLATHQ